MELPNDLKHYGEDSFVIFSGDACVLILCAIIFICIIFPEIARL